MDFMRFLKSVEELLYELVSWLVFYPVTFWRSVTRPAKMMRYADLELGDRLEEQYKDTLSPPLFLLITLLIAHGVELALLARQDRSALPAIFASDTNLLILRAVMYGIFPLIMAVTIVRGRKIRLDRDTLRAPFYSQCYVAAPFAFGSSVGVNLVRMPSPYEALAGWLLIFASVAWYGRAEILWFRADLKSSWPKAVWLFLRGLMVSIFAIVLAAIAIAYALKDWTS